MPPIVIAAGISAAASIGGAAIASKSAKSAAKIQSDAAERAAQRQEQATKEAQAYTQQAMAPYMSLGQFGMGLLTMPGPGPMRGPTPEVATPAPIPQLPQANGGAVPLGGRPLSSFGGAPVGMARPRPMLVQPTAGGGAGLARFGRAPQAY